MKNRLVISWVLFVALAHNAFCQGGAPRVAEKHILRGYTPPGVALGRPLGRLEGTNSLRLAISLPLRHREDLAALLQHLYDPANPEYHHYLTPAQFTEKFGPTLEDYQKVVSFAKSNRLVVASTHASRLLLDVQGKTPDIEHAFHVTLQTYQHPAEARQFHAPDAEPWVDASLPIQDVIGLSDYATLRSSPHKIQAGTQTGHAGGSGPGGYYAGQDFRNAYAPGVSLQGTGQIVGLFEADGYYNSDVTAYEGANFLNPVPLQNVLIDGFSGSPGAGNGEAALDIEMAVSMAPSLTAIVVFESPNNVSDWLDMLDRMASSNQIKQFSSAWGYTGGTDPNTSFDSVFQQMAAQGQSFFQSSGDGDAWVTPIWAPADSPYVTSVGGTSLTTTGIEVAYSSETVWNSGNLGITNAWFAGGNGYWGSGGGVSTVYSIPAWQQGLSMVANLGSTTMRNIPDVSITASNVYVAYNNGVTASFYGTSCSAPLWAGFAALINQQAANLGKPSVGFLNPALYALGQGANSSLCFHDITTGNNNSSGSPANYSAVPGYDLCVGWGTPTGSNLINALTVTPATPAITWTNPASIIYGAALTSSQLNASANTSGSFVYTPVIGTVLNAGTNTLSVIFTPTDTIDYASATNTVSLVVSPAPLTVTANNQLKTYGQSLTLAGTSFISSGLKNSDSVSSVALTSSGATATATVAGSPYNIVPGTAVGTGLTNYTITYANGTLAVSPAFLTVTANNRSKSYGQTATFAGTEFATGGLVNGDTVVSVTLASPGAVATATVAGSPYSLVPSAATGTGLANYTISYANGALTVNPAVMTVTASNRPKTYGQTAVFAGTEFTASGLLNSDAVNSVTLTSSGAVVTATVAGSPYTIVPSAAVGTGIANYTIAYASGTLAVSPAGLTVTANNRSKTYGQTATFAGTEFATGGLVNGDTVTRVTLTSSGATPTATVAGSPYNIVPGAAVGTGLANYAITYANGTLAVSPASLTVTANNRSKTYGQTVIFGGTEFTAGGLINGDTVTGVTLTSSGASAAATVGGSPFSIAPSAAVGTGLANYAIAYINGTLTVGQTASILTWTNTAPILYGTALSSVQLDATANVPGTFTYNMTSGTVLHTGAYPLSVNFTPTDAVDYSNATAAVNLTVSPAPLTVTAANASRPFNQANPSFTGVITGLVNGDNITAAYSCTATTSSQVGSYPIVPSLMDPNNLETNYTVNLVNGLLVVGNPPQIFTWTNPAPVVYGTALTSVQLNAAVNVAGSYAYTPTNGAVLTTGTNTLSVVFTPTDTVDYTNMSGSVTLVVTPAPLSMTAGNTNRAYGQANPVLTGVLAGVTSGDNITATYSTVATVGSPVGTYAITPTLVDPNNRRTNYTIVSTNGTLTVNPAALIVTANNQAKTYGQLLTLAGTAFTTSGLKNSDAVSSVTLGSSGAAATAAVAGSPYTIVPSAAAGAGLTNYTITYANGTLVVSPAALNVTGNNRSKPYGQTATFAGTEFATGGLVNGDTVVSVTLGSPGAVATATVAGSPYSIVPSAAAGTGLANYTITYANGTLTISPAALIVTASNGTKTYGQTAVFAGTEFTASGLLNGDVVNSVTLTSSGAAVTATVAGSPYTIVANAAVGTGIANYTIAYASGTLAVSPAALTVTANNRSKTYGETVTFGGTEFVSGGLVNGDTVTSVSLNSSGVAATASVAGSPYNIVPGAAVGAGLANYAITYANGTLTISPAALTVTANNRSKTYGQTVTFAGTEFTAGGLVNGDTVTSVTLTSSGAAAAATVGGSPYGIVASAAVGTGLANYAIAYVNGTLMVGQTASVVTWSNPASILYGTALSSVQLDATANVPGAFSYNLTSGTVLRVGTYPLSVNFTPTDAVDYSNATTAATLTVSPAPLTVTAANASRPFNQANPTFTGAITGLTNGDSITATYSCSATTGSPVGSYPIVPSLVDPNNLETNYTVNLVNGLLVVGHPPQVFTWTNPVFVIYGIPLTSIQLNAAVNVAGSYAYVPTNGAMLNTGTNTLSVTFTPTDTVDYTNMSGSVTLVVFPAPLSVTAANTNRAYGQVNPVLTGVVAGVTNGDDITATYSTAAANPSVVGTYAVTPTLVDPNNRQTNYTIVSTNGTLTVNPAALTVTANSQAKTYGQSLTLAGTAFAASGLKNSDTVTSVNLGSSGAVATAAVAGSPYAIVPSAAVGTGLANYTITYASGTLTVSPASLTVTANSQTKAYGQAVTLAGTAFTANGLQNGDNVTGVTLSSSGAAVTATVAGSPYAITPGAAVGTGLANYTIAYANGTLTVTPASLTLTANSQTKTYAQTVTFAGTEFAVSGLINGDTVTSATIASSGAAATATVAGSPYGIVPGAAVGTGLANYAISYINGSLTVSPASLAVTANSQTKTYGQSPTLSETAFTASGLQNSDSVVSVTLTSSGAAATASVAGSPYAVVPSAATGIGLGNYTINYANGTFAVGRASLTVTANNLTKTFGQTLTFAGTEFATSGLFNSDIVTNLTLTSSGASATATLAGSPYIIVPSSALGIGLDNYTITYVNGLLTVTSSPVIQSANKSGNLFTFTWSAAATQTYQIQFSTNLSQNTWINFGNPITATNSTATASDSITNSEKFYRVLQLP